MNAEFKETQRFPMWISVIVLLTLGGIPLWGVYEQVIAGNPLGDESLSDTALIILTLISILLGVMVASTKLTTEIDSTGIRMRFFPLTRKSISWDEIESAEVLNYGFVGGWGIRVLTKYGTVYNTRGRIGVAIQPKTGKKFLIGTQKEEELKEIVRKYLT